MDLVVQFYTLLVQALTLFFCAFGHSGIPGNWLRLLTLRGCFGFELARQRLKQRLLREEEALHGVTEIRQ
jgi:hypothetical protein